MSKQAELFDTSTLLPCPFCGAEVEIRQHSKHELKFIQCNTKRCISPSVTDSSSRSLINKGAVKEMIQRWNTRNGQPLEIAAAVDFNSSAASKDGGFLERFG